ncbi:MAG TPA: MBL fold metallo-hydrolase [Noviherbaspirillum sp.]|nr:MBL fold metallo-hydrolase [Noviherbaspirillum sp.]
MNLPPSMRVFERGWLSSNNILFITPGETALVDSGYCTHAEQTLALVQSALGGRRLDRLVNTHLHSDHCGGNALLQRSYGCRTTIPVDEAQAVRAWDEAQLTFAATGQRCERFGFDDTFAPGDVLELGGMAWKALAAPGHDPHALLLHCEAEGILISADALWENGFGVIFPELQGESGFAEQRAVLDLIAQLDLRLVIPGHGRPFTDAKAALQRAYSRLDYLTADPQRNPRHAMKVLVAFLLLERQRMELDAIVEIIGASRLMRAAASQLHPDTGALVAELAGELVRAGAARMEGNALLNVR